MKKETSEKIAKWFDEHPGIEALVILAFTPAIAIHNLIFGEDK